MQNPLVQNTFAHTFFWVCVYSCCFLVLLYIASIVWLASIHIYSISKFLTLYTYATVKDLILRLFGKKEKTQFTSMELDFNDFGIPSESTIQKETAPQTSIKQKSSQAKPLRKSYEKKPPTFRC